ncbi:hypothetical protein GBAR_LOCUS14732 [Geodia barretti]|uniref:Uncharacterized protein n=1 Tax=Geodia barretti TaxID=519541 RepID=A0AA35SAG3_GEOBA|nr:hypothetical protein GBAR_LOCUS14732 [Geodia barretti]
MTKVDKSMVYPGLQMNIPAFYPMQSGHYQHTSIALNHGYSAQNCNCTIMAAPMFECQQEYCFPRISPDSAARILSIAREYAVLLC